MGASCSTVTVYLGRYGQGCGEKENPAEYFLEVTGAGSRSTVTDDWAQIWAESPEHKQSLDTVKTLATDDGSTSRVSTRAESDLRPQIIRDIRLPASERDDLSIIRSSLLRFCHRVLAESRGDRVVRVLPIQERRQLLPAVRI